MLELKTVIDNPCKDCLHAYPDTLKCENMNNPNIPDFRCSFKESYDNFVSQRDADQKILNPMRAALEHVKHAHLSYSRNNPDWEYVWKQVDKALEENKQ